MAPPSAAHSLAATPVGFGCFLIATTVIAASAADPYGVAKLARPSRFRRARRPSEFGVDLQPVGLRVHGGQVLAAQAGLRTMWQTMTKDSRGRIDRRSLRYMVQRYFRQNYHISIIGMENLQVKSTASAAEATVLAELTPNFVRSALEGASAEAGFSFEDTLALVAVIERLVEDVGHEHLEASYKDRGLDATGLLNRDELLDVMKYYMVRWLYGQDNETIAKLEADRALFEQTLEKFSDFMGLAEGHILAFEHQHLHAVSNRRPLGSGLKELWNPLRPLFSFADAQAVISGMSTQFGSFWETECEGLMQVLLKSERRGTGRVPLSSFHARALHGEWHFTESAEYLRQLGVLDESSMFHGPQVIASNYMQSSNNCVVTQKHFRVCCASPCQDIYTDIEEFIRAPEGAPEDVLALVSNLTYGLDDANPRLTKKLRAQLQEIAQGNHGKIPLHGRLFAQWLHFVFPTECPFPHKSNSVSGLSPMECGADRCMATVEEMRENAKQGKDKARAIGGTSADGETKQHEDDSLDELMDMWSNEEELLSQHVRQSLPSTLPSLHIRLRPLLYALAALSVFVFGVLQPAIQTFRVAGEHSCSLGRLMGWKEKAANHGETKSHSV